MRRANRPIGAIAADEASFRSELSRANVRRGFLHNFLRFIQLLGVPRGFLPPIVLQIMKHQPHRVQLQNFFNGQRVQAQL